MLFHYKSKKYERFWPFWLQLQFEGESRRIYIIWAITSEIGIVLKAKPSVFNILSIAGINVPPSSQNSKSLERCYLIFFKIGEGMLMKDWRKCDKIAWFMYYYHHWASDNIDLFWLTSWEKYLQKSLAGCYAEIFNFSEKDVNQLVG